MIEYNDLDYDDDDLDHLCHVVMTIDQHYQISAAEELDAMIAQLRLNSRLARQVDEAECPF